MWTCSGGGSGDIQATQFGGQGGGTQYGYRSGGYYPGADTVQDRYSYATDGNATAVQSLTTGTWAHHGAQSETHVYSMGSAVGGGEKKVEKTTFANTTTQSNLGNLLQWNCTGPTAPNSSTHI